jgi:putative membrane protein
VCLLQEEEEQEEDDVAEPSLKYLVARRPGRHSARPPDERLEQALTLWVEPASLLQQELTMKSTFLAVIALLVSITAHAAEKPSQAFIKKAVQGNFAEIQIGQLAQQNGQSDGVKQYGQMLVADHSLANQKATEAAKSIGVTPPEGPSAARKAHHDKLSKMTGARFDSEFATYMITDHQKEIAEYKKAAKRSDAAAEYARGQIDILQKHLDTAKSLKSNR